MVDIAGAAVSALCGAVVSSIVSLFHSYVTVSKHAVRIDALEAGQRDIMDKLVPWTEVQARLDAIQSTINTTTADIKETKLLVQRLFIPKIPTRIGED